MGIFLNTAKADRFSYLHETGKNRPVQLYRPVRSGTGYNSGWRYKSRNVIFSCQGYSIADIDLKIKSIDLGEKVFTDSNSDLRTLTEL
jgi:hypothetical protein